MLMRFDVISLFSKSLEEYFDSSILGRAQKKRLIKINNHDLRRWAHGTHNRVDDTPYGGGPGMVMRIDVVHRALKAIYTRKNSGTRVILLTPRGKTYDQRIVKRLAKYKRIVLIAGRYEAIDARIDRYVDEKISLGNFILTGGELAAACVIDSVARILPGVIGDAESLESESYNVFKNGKTNIEYPHYTRPDIYDGRRVPRVLMSGDHGAIQQWRSSKARSRNTK